MTTSRYRRLMWASTLMVALLATGVEGCTFSRAQSNAADLEQRVANLLPGTSKQPAFVVQVVRPRAGLPLGGLLPPKLFGVDAHLGCDSNTDGAEIRFAGEGRIEIRAEGWELLLTYDADGRVTPETYVVFDLVFEERQRRVRGRPSDPVAGRLRLARLEDGAELAGSFDITLAHCEDAETGESLGWPPRPLVLHGSFDRLPSTSAAP